MTGFGRYNFMLSIPTGMGKNFLGTWNGYPNRYINALSRVAKP